VQHHGAGKGFPNTPQAAYSCGFDKSSYTMKEAGLVNVRLVNDPNVKQRFQIISLSIAGDSKGEYQQRTAAGDSASFYGKNLTAQSIYFSVYVLDSVTGAVVECDPTVLNVPT